MISFSTSIVKIILNCSTCDSWNCLDSCKAAGYLRGGVAPSTNNAATVDMLVPIQTNMTSHRDGHLEPACRTGYRNLHASTTCVAWIEREMAIAFVNRFASKMCTYSIWKCDYETIISFKCSDFHDHVRESDEWDDYSPCDEHFDTRYAIGTHAARSMRKLKNWSSLDAHPIYVSFSENLNLTLKDTFDVLHLFPP